MILHQTVVFVQGKDFVPRLDVCYANHEVIPRPAPDIAFGFAGKRLFSVFFFTLPIFSASTNWQKSVSGHTLTFNVKFLEGVGRPNADVASAFDCHCVCPCNRIVGGSGGVSRSEIYVAVSNIDVCSLACSDMLFSSG